MANIPGKVLSNQSFTHLEIETNKQDVQKFLIDLQNEVQSNPNTSKFRLQIQKSGVSPMPGGGTTISSQDSVTISLHHHP